MTKIDESLLETLTSEQISYSGNFLELVFSLKQTNLDGFNESQLHTISTLITAVTSLKMKTAIISALAESVLPSFIPNFLNQDLQALFNGYSKLPYLESVFKQLPEIKQTTLLNFLYNKNKKRYSHFKRLLNDKVSMHGGIIVRQEQVLKQFMEKEKHLLLDLFENPKATTAHATSLSKKFEKKYDYEDLDLICQELITTFNKKKLSLNNATSFNVYLKFFFFIDPFIKQFNELTSTLKPLLDSFIMALDAMPSPEWAVKVLNQLPTFVLQRCLLQLKSHESISQFEKRQLYSKILKEITAHCLGDDGENIRYAFSQL
jgi:hypothetical protein